MYESRKRLSVLVPLAECPLRAMETLVYSYLAKRASFDETAKKSEIASATGIHVNSVSDILDRIEFHGLINEGKAVYKPEWFKPKRSEKHWYYKIKYWTYYVPAATPLTVHDAIVYSWLLARFLAIKEGKEHSPPDGWTITYIAVATGIDARTVGKSLDRLKALNLACLTDRTLKIKTQLSGITLEYFQPMGQKLTSKDVGVQLVEWEDDYVVEHFPQKPAQTQKPAQKQTPEHMLPSVVDRIECELKFSGVAIDDDLVAEIYGILKETNEFLNYKKVTQKVLSQKNNTVIIGNQEQKETYNERA